MQRNHAIDSMRLFCAFLVICIHTPFPGDTGLVVTSIARTAVPFFFIVSGYYFAYKEKTPYKPIKKVLLLILEATVIYSVWVTIILIVGNHDIIRYFGEMLSIKNIWRLLIFNYSPVRDHLWYLNALLGVYIIEIAVHRCGGGERILRILAIPLLLIGLCLGKYVFLFHVSEVQPYYYRNMFFVGIPFFEIGRYIKEKQYKGKKIKISYAVIGFLWSLVFLLVEVAILRKLHFRFLGELYLFTPFVSVTLFVLLLQTDYSPFLNKQSKLSRWGNCYAGYIYILQFISIDLLDKIRQITSRVIITTWFTPIAVFVLSMILSVFYIKTKNCLKNFCKKCLIHFRLNKIVT